MTKNIKAKLEDTVLVKSVQNRLHKQNKNWIALIIGETGSGKSYSALRLAELIDPDFSLGQIVLRAPDFLELIREGVKDNKGGYTPLKRGNIIVWDEAGVSLPSRQWQSIQNQMMDFLLQTFRFRNIGVIFTCPNFRMIDYHARCMLHTYMECTGVDFAHKRTQLKVYNFEYSNWQDKIYRHLLVENGEKINVWGLGLPECIDLEKYEEKKKEFTDELYSNISKVLSGEGNKKESTMIQAERQLREGHSALEVADELEIPLTNVMKYQSTLRAAGALAANK